TPPACLADLEYFWDQRSRAERPRCPDRLRQPLRSARGRRPADSAPPPRPSTPPPTSNRAPDDPPHRPPENPCLTGRRPRRSPVFSGRKVAPRVRKIKR